MGNKISIKEKFETFITLTPENVLSSLQEILTQRLSDEDIKLGILPNVIRKFIQDNPETFTVTITECINHVFVVAGQEQILPDNEVIYLNNVLMFIMRFLPILHEQNYKEFTSKLLWTKTNFPQDKAQDLKVNPYVMDECLAIKLLTSLFRLMFHPEYTIMAKKIMEPQKIRLGGLIAEERNLWRFYNSYRNDNDNIKYYYNRSKVLECLLACFSSPILSPNNSKARMEDPWIQFCISGQNPLLGSALISCMNLGLSYEENGYIPYTQYFTGDAGGEKLALLSLQIVSLFSDIEVGEDKLYQLVLESNEHQQIVQYYLKCKENKMSIDIAEVKNTQNIKETLNNAVLKFLREFKLTEFFDFISEHILRVLKNPYDAENTFLIESKKKTVLIEEVLIVFWRLIENNPTYLQNLFNQKEFLPIIVHLLYQIHESFASAMRSSVFYLSLIILSKLSTDRLFSIQLKKKYKNDIGFTRIPIFVGNHIDLLFIIFLNGIIDSLVNNFQCYQINLLAVLHNVSPYAKDLCPITTSLLIQLITTTATPKILRLDKNHMLTLRRALNLIHKILCYQPETCVNLLYELMAQKNELEYLKKLPLKKIYAPKLVPKEPSVSVNPEANKEEESKGTEKVSPQKNNKDNTIVEEKKEPTDTQLEKINQAIESNQGMQIQGQNQQPQIQLFDAKWMEIYEYNLVNDLIFIVSDYLQKQLRETFRERLTNSEEEVKAFLGEQSIIGIVPQPGPIIVETIYDPENINSNLFLFLWQQIFYKNQGLPYFDSTENAA